MPTDHLSGYSHAQTPGIWSDWKGMMALSDSVWAGKQARAAQKKKKKKENGN